MFERPRVFAGRVTEATVISSDHHVCTGDGTLIHRGLNVGEINPIRWLGGVCRGQDSSSRYLIDLSGALAPLDQECIFLGGKANFGHFVFEDLMRLALLSWVPEARHLPVAVYDDLPVQYLEFLTLMGFPPDRRIAIPRTPPSAFAAVWLLSAPLRRQSPRHIAAIWPEAVWALRLAFAYVSATVPQTVNSRRPRYYLVRGNVRWRRLVNEPTLMAMMAQYGVTPIDFAGLSARKQIEVVANAEILILPIGAGGAITLFAATDCAVIEMSPPNFSAAFGAIGFAAICGRPYVRVVGRQATTAEIAAAGLSPNSSTAKIDADYVIDTTEFERILIAADTYLKNGPPTVAPLELPAGKSA